MMNDEKVVSRFVIRDSQLGIMTGRRIAVKHISRANDCAAGASV